MKIVPILFKFTLFAVLVLVFFAWASTSNEPEHHVLTQPVVQTGNASWYSYKIGGWNSKDHAACASRDYPRWTKLVVVYKNHGVICTVTDYVENHKVIIDLSPFVFKQFAPLSKGIIQVSVFVYETAQ